MQQIKKFFFIFLVFFFFIHFLESSEAIANFNSLLEGFHLERARQYLTDISPNLKRKEVQNAYFRLSDAYYLNLQYIKSLECYRASGRSGSRLSHLTNLAGLEYLARRDYSQALRCFRITANRSMTRRTGIVRSGDDYLEKGDFPKAMEFFKRAEYKDAQARCYGLMADTYWVQGRAEKAGEYYGKAVALYREILASFDYWWNDEYNINRLLWLKKLQRLPKSDREKEKQARLQEILDGLAGYCKKLESRSIYFYCRENVQESIDYSVLGRETNVDFTGGGMYASSPRGKKATRYKYDYQLHRKGDSIQEKRRLIWRDDRRNVKKDEWVTKSIVFKKIIFGPLGIFNKYWQSNFDYEIVAETQLEGVDVVVIEAVPTHPLKINAQIGRVQGFGRVWVSTGDYSVMKIQWMPKSLGNNANLRKTGYAAGQKPGLSFVTEFMLKREGIRYPTKSYYREFLLDGKGRQNTFVSLDVAYKDFKFFDVGADVVDLSVEK